MNYSIKFQKKQVWIVLKGMAMGIADVVPGVSGGTIAFITGIYDQLVESISLVNKEFFQLLLKFKIKQALGHINFSFLFPLLSGIFLSIILGAKVMHYLLDAYPTQTWSLFFGLIAASIYFIGKQIDEIYLPKNFGSIIAGTAVGYILVSLIPVTTAHNSLTIFFSGAVAICAMILPGISGSFILLILGKYAYITGAVKQPFAQGNLTTIIIFALGCLVGLLSFSKLLNWLLKHFHNIMMCFMTGFMLGSMKKIWPWKEALSFKIIRGKTYILEEANVLPSNFDQGFWIALALMFCGFILVIFLEKISDH